MQSVMHLTADPGVTFESHLSHIAFVEIDQDIISMVILFFLLIQERQLSIE